MAKKNFPLNKKANEAIGKFKMLSSYGGPGSLIHTNFDCSVLVSCIEEWGFLKEINQLRDTAISMHEPEEEYVIKHARAKGMLISNDTRLLVELQTRKSLKNLKYLVLIPDIDIDERFNTIKEDVNFAINSTYMPKGFFDGIHQYKLYSKWYDEWDDTESFHPPRYKVTSKEKEYVFPLKQDNLILICENGHITDFPWSKYLNWKVEFPYTSNEAVNLFEMNNCCNSPLIQIKDTSAHATGYDGKWLRCNNKGCKCNRGVSLKGITSVKIKCPGHKPWEAETGQAWSYEGNPAKRKKDPQGEKCDVDHLKVALTTGNNLYYSRTLSSIYMPAELFMEENKLKLIELNNALEEAKRNNQFEKCLSIMEQIKEIEAKEADKIPNTGADVDREILYRFQEFQAFATKDERNLNINSDLIIKEVTENLESSVSPYFSRILRIDNLKVTTTQLDFSRVSPNDGDAENIQSKNIFRSSPDNILSYPVVENFGEGIFFAFRTDRIKSFVAETGRFVSLLKRKRNQFAAGAIRLAQERNWPLYLIHTFSHLIMRELEFRCGYPTASLSERIYVSNDERTPMYGCMIYTSEGAEGSMGGLIAQTRKENMNHLIKSALVRSTVCNSDPLCWESDGQGLFDLNLASCFSCSLTSETSCELRNIYLDRRILVDPNTGFFKDLLR